MAVISKNEIGIRNGIPDISKKMSEKASKIRFIFNLAWNYLKKVVRLVFIQKSEPNDKNAKETYLNSTNEARIFAPSTFNQFIK